MTVRKVIWLWQVLEALLFGCLLNVFWPLPVAVLLVVPLMIFLRVFMVGVVTGMVAVSTPQYRLSPRQFLRYWLTETMAFCRLYFWYQAKPRAALAPAVVRQRHVILVHGFLCNDGFWQPLARALAQQGYSVSSVEMPEVFADIDRFSGAIAVEINRIQQISPSTDIALVAFSMGGLACCALPTSVQQTLSLITLHTPYSGSNMACVVGALGASNGRQMCPDSDWLTALHQRPTAFSSHLALWSRHDTVVLLESGKAPPKTLILSGRGHLSAAFDTRIHRHVVRLLKVMAG